MRLKGGVMRELVCKSERRGRGDGIILLDLPSGGWLVGEVSVAGLVVQLSSPLTLFQETQP